MQNVARRGIRKFEVACVAWMDLLGYGSMLTEASFDPFNELSDKAIQRLYDFHKVVRSKANRNFDVLALNDGVAAFRDLKPNSNVVSSDFLTASIDLFKAVQEKEFSEGFPGARMVIATGYRVRGEEGKRMLFILAKRAP